MKPCSLSTSQMKKEVFAKCVEWWPQLLIPHHQSSEKSRREQQIATKILNIFGRLQLPNVSGSDICMSSSLLYGFNFHFLQHLVIFLTCFNHEFMGINQEPKNRRQTQIIRISRKILLKGYASKS